MSEEKQDALDALLGAEVNEEKDVYIKRLGTYFTITPINGTDFDKITDRATYYVGKGKNKRKEVDKEKFNALLIDKACKSPDFSNEKLHEKYGVSDSLDCIKKAIYFGESTKLMQEIMALSGFDDDEESVEEVKN